MAEVEVCSPYSLGYGKTKEDILLWIRHFQQVAESGGFDFDVIPPNVPGVCNGILPWDDVTEVEPFAMKALEKFNSVNGEDYRFVEVKKVNSQLVQGELYYITFEAIDAGVVDDGGDVGDGTLSLLFEARVYEPLFGDPKVEFCRYKPFRGWRPFVVDTEKSPKDERETKEKQKNPKEKQKKKKKKGRQRMYR